MSKYSEFKKFMALLWVGDAMERHLDKAIDQQSHDELKAAVKQGDMTQDSASSIVLSIACADHCTAPLLARIAELEAALTEARSWIGDGEDSICSFFYPKECSNEYVEMVNRVDSALSKGGAV